MSDLTVFFFILSCSIGLFLFACSSGNKLSDNTIWKLLILASILYIIGILLVTVQITSKVAG